MSASSSILYVVALWLGVLLASLVTTAFTETGKFGVADGLCWALNGGMCLGLVSLSRVRDFLEGLSVGRAVIVGTMFFAVALGVVTPGVPREANFPFLTWDMFSKATFYTKPEFTWFAAVRADSSEFRFNPVRVMPALRHARCSCLLSWLLGVSPILF